MTKELKDEWTKVFEETLKEYEEGRHKPPTCKLCIFTGRCLEWGGMDNKKCTKCPMNVFKISKFVGCSERNCRPINSSQTFYNKEELKVIAFYKEAIKLWKKLRVKKYEKFNGYTDNVWSRRIKLIDKQIAKQYD